MIFTWVTVFLLAFFFGMVFLTDLAGECLGAILRLFSSVGLADDRGESLGKKLRRGGSACCLFRGAG